MDSFAFNLLVIPVLLLILSCIFTFLPGGSIPGPRWRLPVLGHLHLLRSKPHLMLTRMQKVYGSVFQLRLGPNRAVVISGRDTIKAACAKAQISGRPHKLFNSWKKHERYFAFGHSSMCFKYRKITMKALTEFAKNHVDEMVTEKSEQLADQLCQLSDQRQHAEVVRRCVAAISFHMCFGRVTNDTGKVMAEVMDSIDNIMTFAKQAGFADSFPWATFIPSVRRKYSLFLKAQDSLVRLVKKQVAAHESESRLSDSHPDLCDKLKDSWAQQTSADGVNDPDNRSGIGTAQEQTGMLLIAGTETVATSLNWAVLMLAVHPIIQDEIFEEVMSQQTCTELNPKMEAFLLEVLRFSMASPLAMPHFTLDCVEINGYTIPKDTLILINLWSGSRDRRVWGDNAEEFKPSRFLDTQSQRIDRALADEVIAFGSGRRRCAGEFLARAELALMLTVIVRRCRVELVYRHQEIDFWSNNAARNIAPVVPLRFTAR